MSKAIRFIDLFAGIGGTRIGFTEACDELGIDTQCVFSSEIKPHAITAYNENFSDKHKISGDITQITPQTIPDFNILLAGFPCQPFSAAGNRKGFLDERGGLFFTIVNILNVKKPDGFLLENVEGLVNHNKGKTLKTMLGELEKLNYYVSYKVLDASDFGVPQKRRRVYIIGHKKPLTDFLSVMKIQQKTGVFIDEEYDFEPSAFSYLLTSHYSKVDLYGKSIKDKRGGENNIHSWNIGLKGEVNQRQANLMEEILKKRRYKKWAENKGIDWMDGMPLTTAEIQTFLNYPKLQADLTKLTEMGYLCLEYPKQRVNVNGVYKRVPKTDAEKGYNIIAGKLSFPFAHILDPDDLCPTIVATEVGKIAVATDKGVRPITVKEGLGFSGFPKDYDLSKLSYREAFDLIGNTVMPPVIKAVSLKLLEGAC